MKVYPINKSVLDFLLCLFAILLLFPCFILIGALIKIDSKGPVFFKQKRIGKNKEEFYIYKFRTMRTDSPTEMPTHLLQNPELFITRIGKFLRKSSLDELPQIINIIKGEMSIVGPRPALWNQYDLIAERDKFRANDVRPGLTGWAQINGRDELPVHIKAELDGYYTNNINFTLDLRIIFHTILNVISAKGISEGARQHNKENSSSSLTSGG